MIPKTIHNIWLGGPLRPDDVARAGLWKAMHPDWRLVLHTDQPGEWAPWDETRHIGRDGWINSECIGIFEDFAPERWVRAAASDIIRLEVVAREGGVYLDLDVHPVRAIDGLVAPIECFLSEECGKVHAGNFVVGAAAGHPALYSAMREINRRCRELLTNGVRLNPVEHTGPWAVEASMRKHGSCVVLPYRLLSPWPGHFRWDEAFLAGVPKESYAVHLFNTTWGKRPMKNPRTVADPWAVLPITN